MSRSLSVAACLAFLALPVASCIIVVDKDHWDGSFWGHSVHGSGVRAESDRTVPEFHSIELETSAKVAVRVGEGPSLHLAGDDNLLAKVETRVKNGVLTIDVDESCDWRCGLELVIGTPALERFTVEGSGEVEIHGLAADEVELAIEGSGTVHAQGTARALVGSIEGSGTLGLDELHADEAELSIEGSGSMVVRVAKTLRYSIEGSGDIRYAGEPNLDGEIDGSGNVEHSR
jgi:hypothetical protein